MEGEDDGSQVLQADHGDVAVNPRDLWVPGISRRPAAGPGPPLPPQLPHPDLALDLQHSDAPGFLPHLLHPALGQAQVRLEVVAGDDQAQQAEADDGPEARGVVGRVRHAGGKRRGRSGRSRGPQTPPHPRGRLMGEVVAAVVGRMGGYWCWRRWTGASVPQFPLERGRWGTVGPTAGAPLTSAPSACPWARGAGNPVRWA